MYAQCVGTHACVCLPLCGFTCVWTVVVCIRRSEVNLRVTSQAPPRLLLRQVSQCVLGSLISLGWLAVSPSALSVSAWGSQYMLPCVAHGSGRSDSDAQASTASAWLMEPSLQTLRLPKSPRTS